MAEKKKLTARQLAAMGRLYGKALAEHRDKDGDAPAPKSLWRVTAAALPGPDGQRALDVAYRVSNALGWKVASDELVESSRRLVEKWLVEGGVTGQASHPWGASALAAEAETEDQTAAERVAEKARAAAERLSREAAAARQVGVDAG
jgi:hypothetical protein